MTQSYGLSSPDPGKPELQKAASKAEKQASLFLL